MKFKNLLRSAIFLCFSLAYMTAFPAWINYEPQIITQPDGTVIHCFATGDEFYNWLHNQEGFTIIQNHQNGYYYYAVMDGDQLVPSTFKAGTIDPASIGLVPWTNISGDAMEAIRADFLKNYMPAKLQIWGYSSPENAKNEGVLNDLVVYIRFSDQSEFSEDTLQYYNIFNNTNTGFNSMQNFFKTVSYDMISILSWFYPVPPSETVISYQDIYPRNYFMPYDPVTNPNGYQGDQGGEREHALLKRACLYIEDEVPDNLIIDKNLDGYVDNMVFIVRGATTAWATLLWPHRWALYNEVVYINGKRVWDYNLQVEDHLNGSGAGVLCHEMFHSLSAPDLYHYNSAPYTSVGPWDLMDASDNPPQSMGAYMKFRYGGWIEQIPEITECGTYTINPLSEPENNCYKIESPNSSSQYYVVEYRVKIGTFEGGLPGSGLLVYRIDDAENGNGNAQGPPDEVYVYRPNGTINVNGNLSQAHYAADYGRTEINDNTNPSPFLQNGQPGGLNIANIGFTGETISFDVFFEKEPVTDFTASEMLITPGCSVNFTDESVCEVSSWQWTFEGGTPAYSADQNPQDIIWNNPGTYSVSLTTNNSWGSDTETKTGFITVSDNALPVVEFFAVDSVTCTGGVIIIKDSSAVCPESWLWEISPASFEFVNGTSTNSQDIEIILNDPGYYSVSLTVSNANGSASTTKEEYLKAGGASVPFTEDFENDDLASKGWTIVNPDNNITWELFNVAGNGGDKATGINLFLYYSILKRDQLISPAIDLSGQPQAGLSFQHAYAQSLNTQYSDSLIVKISTDCGNTWTRILELAEDGSYNFATHAPFGYNFIPASPADWCGGGFGAPCITIDISNWAGNPDTRLMFESVRMVGNNLFIDNINLYPITSVPYQYTALNNEISIYPNPGRGEFTISMPESNTPVELKMYDIHGKCVYTSREQATSGQIKLNPDIKTQGLYFIELQGESASWHSRVIIQ